MVRFQKTSVAVEIYVNEKHCGCISKLENGFSPNFNAPVMSLPRVISANDLREIAKKSDEVEQFGIDPPKCPDCHNTPYFPVCEYPEYGSSKEGKIVCTNEIHSR